MTQLKNIFRQAHQLVGPYSIIKELRKVFLNSYDLPVHVYVSSISPVNRIKLINPEVSGVGLNDQEALTSCLGEAVERYSWLSLSPERVILSTESHISKEAIPVEKAGFLIPRDLSYDEVFGKLKNVKIPWLEGKSLLDDSKVLIPAIDFYPHLLPNKEMEKWTISTTSGIAAGDTFSDACLSAVYEIIERDAVMQFWYRMRSGQERYAIKNQCEGIEQIFNKCKIISLKLRIINITTELGIPCCFAFLYRDKIDKELFASGAACRLSDREAAKKSLLETAAMWNSLSAIKSYRQPLDPSEASLGFPNINNFEDHAFLYSHSWAKEGYKFLFSVPYTVQRRFKGSKIKNKSSKEKLEFVVKRLHNKGYNTFVIDITPDDVRSLGLYVVKVIIPGLIPVSVGKYNAFYVDRFRANVTHLDVYNRWPHPLP